MNVADVVVEIVAVVEVVAVAVVAVAMLEFEAEVDGFVVGRLRVEVEVVVVVDIAESAATAVAAATQVVGVLLLLLLLPLTGPVNSHVYPPMPLLPFHRERAQTGLAEARASGERGTGLGGGRARPHLLDRRYLEGTRVGLYCRERTLARRTGHRSTSHGFRAWVCGRKGSLHSRWWCQLPLRDYPSPDTPCTPTERCMCCNYYSLDQ